MANHIISPTRWGPRPTKKKLQQWQQPETWTIGLRLLSLCAVQWPSWNAPTAKGMWRAKCVSGMLCCVNISQLNKNAAFRSSHRAAQSLSSFYSLGVTCCLLGRLELQLMKSCNEVMKWWSDEVINWWWSDEVTKWKAEVTRWWMWLRDEVIKCLSDVIKWCVDWMKWWMNEIRKWCDEVMRWWSDVIRWWVDEVMNWSDERMGLCDKVIKWCRRGKKWWMHKVIMWWSDRVKGWSDDDVVKW